MKMIGTGNNISLSTTKMAGKKLPVMASLVLISLMLTSCGVYSSGFNCPDSRGARCVMLSQVDTMVDSGEIETVYLDKKCKNGKCQEVVNVPKKSLPQPYIVKLDNLEDIGGSDSEVRDTIEEGDNLYLK